MNQSKPFSLNGFIEVTLPTGLKSTINITAICTISPREDNKGTYIHVQGLPAALQVSETYAQVIALIIDAQ